MDSFVHGYVVLVDDLQYSNRNSNTSVQERGKWVIRCLESSDQIFSFLLLLIILLLNLRTPWIFNYSKVVLVNYSWNAFLQGRTRATAARFQEFDAAARYVQPVRQSWTVNAPRSNPPRTLSSRMRDATRASSVDTRPGRGRWSAGLVDNPNSPPDKNRNSIQSIITVPDKECADGFFIDFNGNCVQGFTFNFGRRRRWEQYRTVKQKHCLYRCNVDVARFVWILKWIWASIKLLLKHCRQTNECIFFEGIKY